MPRRIPEFLDTMAESVNGYHPLSQLTERTGRVKKTKMKRRKNKQEDYDEGSLLLTNHGIQVSDGISSRVSLSPASCAYGQQLQAQSQQMTRVSPTQARMMVPSLLVQGQQSMENDSACFGPHTGHAMGHDVSGAGLVANSGQELGTVGEEYEEGVFSNGEGKQSCWDREGGLSRVVDVRHTLEDTDLGVPAMSAMGMSNVSGQQRARTTSLDLGSPTDVEMDVHGVGLQQESMFASLKTEARAKRKIGRKGAYHGGLECGGSVGEKKRRVEDRPQPTAASSRVPAAALSAEDRLVRIRNLSAELKKSQKTIARLRHAKETSDKEVEKAHEILQAKPLLDKINATAKICSDHGYPDVIGLICDAILSGSLPMKSIRFERLVTLGVNCNKEFTNQLQYSDTEMTYFATLKRQSCAAAVLEAMRGPMNAGGGHGRHAVRSARITEFVPSLKAIERFEKQLQLLQQQQQQHILQNSQQPEEQIAVSQPNHACQQLQAVSGSVGSHGSGEDLEGGAEGVVFDNCPKGAMMGSVYDGGNQVCTAVSMGGAMVGNRGNCNGGIAGGCAGAPVLHMTASSSPRRAISPGAGSQTGGNFRDGGVHLIESDDEDEVKPLDSCDRVVSYPNAQARRAGVVVGIQPSLDYVHVLTQGDENEGFDCIQRQQPPLQDPQQSPPSPPPSQQPQQHQQPQQQQQQQSSQHQGCVAIQQYDYLQVPVTTLHGLGMELESGLPPAVALQTSASQQPQQSQQQPTPQQVGHLQYEAHQIQVGPHQVSNSDVCIHTSSPGRSQQQQHEEKAGLQLFPATAQLQEQEQQQQQQQQQQQSAPQQQQSQQPPDSGITVYEQNLMHMEGLDQLTLRQLQALRQFEEPVQLAQFDEMRVGAFGQLQAEDIARYNPAMVPSGALSTLQSGAVFDDHEQQENVRQQHNMHEATSLDLRVHNFHPIMQPFSVLGLHSPLAFPPYLLTAAGQDLGRFSYPCSR